VRRHPLQRSTDCAAPINVVLRRLDSRRVAPSRGRRFQVVSSQFDNPGYNVTSHRSGAGQDGSETRSYGGIHRMRMSWSSRAHSVLQSAEGRAMKVWLSGGARSN